MEMKTKAAIVSLGVILNGCATMTKSALLGAAIGGFAGGTIGQNQAHSPEGSVTGLAIGAGLSSLLGYYAFKQNEEKNLLKQKPDDDLPFLTKPKIRSVIVPDSVEGNKYIKSHRIYILDDAGYWSKE